MWTPRAPLCLLLAAALAACGDNAKDEEQSSVLDDAPRRSSAGEPERVVVDHILIGVRSDRFPNGKYSADEARKLAYGLLDELKDGADWDEFKRRHSEDPPPGGPYPMSNRGVMPRRGEIPRDDMVRAFGDVGFELEVGEIGIADYDPRPKQSPFGYHIIKRVK